jgi:phosphopantothenoylcysteine decarboxylase / phosphopantothenate---cysteine ligase
MGNLKNRTILLGITGGIAAYKTCELTRLLVKGGADVHVVMTKSAEQFVTPLTLQTLSQNKIHTDLFDLEKENEIGHINLADKADLIVVAPATANTIAKVTHGLCDDLLTTVISATKAKVVFAPAMNCNMWENPVTKRNVGQLKELNYYIIEPASGELACGYEGDGRMAEPEAIFQKISELP